MGTRLITDQGEFSILNEWADRANVLNFARSFHLIRIFKTTDSPRTSSTIRLPTARLNFFEEIRLPAARLNFFEEIHLPAAPRTAARLNFFEEIHLPAALPEL